MERIIMDGKLYTLPVETVIWRQPVSCWEGAQRWMERIKTALHWASRNGHMETARLLLESGAEEDGKDSNRWTALHCASRNDHSETVRLLLEKGAAADGTNNDGGTALSRYGHLETVRLLLEKDAAVDGEDKDGNTALYWACKYGHLDTVHLLLDKGALVDGKNKSCHTPRPGCVRVHIIPHGYPYFTVHISIDQTCQGHDIAVPMGIERGLGTLAAIDE
jgi:ankyrin repeat protein